VILRAWVKVKHSSRYKHYDTKQCVITDTVQLLGTLRYTSSLFLNKTSHLTDVNVFTLSSGFNYLTFAFVELPTQFKIILQNTNPASGTVDENFYGFS
jgi:hypothetical protein